MRKTDGRDWWSEYVEASRSELELQVEVVKRMEFRLELLKDEIAKAKGRLHEGAEAKSKAYGEAVRAAMNISGGSPVARIFRSSNE